MKCRALPTYWICSASIVSHSWLHINATPLMICLDSYLKSHSSSSLHCPDSMFCFSCSWEAQLSYLFLQLVDPASRPVQKQALVVAHVLVAPLGGNLMNLRGSIGPASQNYIYTILYTSQICHHQLLYTSCSSWPKLTSEM